MLPSGTILSPDESGHLQYRFLDFNGDGTLNIVPQMTDENPSNLLARLNDGTRHYMAGLKIRDGSESRLVEFFARGDERRRSAGWVGLRSLRSLRSTQPAKTGRTLGR